MSIPGHGPAPIPPALWAKIQKKRRTLQDERYTGKLVITLDLKNGEDRRVTVAADEVAEVEGA